MNTKYRKVFAEVLEVLNHADSEIKLKIPVNFIKFLRRKCGFNTRY